MPRLRIHDLHSIHLVEANNLNHPFPLHTHHSLIIGLVTRGTRQMIYTDDICLVPAGQIFVVHPGEAHACLPANDSDLDYRVLCLEPEWLARHFPGGLRLPHNINTPLDTAGLLACLDSALQPDAENRLLAFLTSLAERHALPAQQEVVHPPAVEKARRYLDAHTNEPVPIQNLGQAVNLSPFHLNRLFRRTLGLPPHTYQLQAKIQRAQRLLASGSSPVETACALGFSDQSHFSRFFKKYTGLTPAAYQRQNREDSSGAGAAGSKDGQAAA